MITSHNIAFRICEYRKGSQELLHDSRLEWYRNLDIRTHWSWSIPEDPSKDWFQGIADELPKLGSSSFSRSLNFWQTRHELVSNIQEATAIPVHEHHYSSGIQLIFANRQMKEQKTLLTGP